MSDVQPISKQDLISTIAHWAGGLGIAASRMTEEALRDEVLQTVREMTVLVQRYSSAPMWISGMGVPRQEP